MFPAEAFTSEWINVQRKQLGGCDPGILEKCVHALTLLGGLVESGLPFLFKGGTSLLLHLPQARRLSRDIDIVCGRPAAEIEAVVASLGKQSPFLRLEEDVRGARGLRKRRHYKFFYRSALTGNAEQEVLLDIVEESREVHSIVNLPIRTHFLIPVREVLVRVPTVESLLGDKLTAFAPTTTGVPLRKADNSDGDVQQVAKQLFDVGVLFEVAKDFRKIAEAYDAVWAMESEYRASRPTRDAALNDTWNACLALTATKQKHLALYPDAALLHSGLDRMAGHLTWQGFRGPEPRRLLAARAAVLVAHLRTGRILDFAASRYTGSAEQITALRSASLNGTAYNWIDAVKAVNPEAYYYWHLALSQ